MLIFALLSFLWLIVELVLFLVSDKPPQVLGLWLMISGVFMFVALSLVGNGARRKSVEKRNKERFRIYNNRVYRFDGNKYKNN